MPDSDPRDTDDDHRGDACRDTDRAPDVDGLPDDIYGAFGRGRASTTVARPSTPTKLNRDEDCDGWPNAGPAGRVGSRAAGDGDGLGDACDRPHDGDCP